MTEFVRYTPDKGASYRQVLPGRGVRQAWAFVQSFLARCTQPSPPGHVSLTAHTATEWDLDPAVAEACVARVVARFGPPHQDYGFLRHWPSGEARPGHLLTWQGSEETLEGMIPFLAEGEPWPKQTLGPVEVHFSVRFRWRNPSSDELLPLPRLRARG